MRWEQQTLACEVSRHGDETYAHRRARTIVQLAEARLQLHTCSASTAGARDRTPLVLENDSQKAGRSEIEPRCH
jgi:hypothetical protein